MVRLNKNIELSKTSPTITIVDNETSTQQTTYPLKELITIQPILINATYNMIGSSHPSLKKQKNTPNNLTHNPTNSFHQEHKKHQQKRFLLSQLTINT